MNHARTKLWICEVPGCAATYELPALDPPLRRTDGTIVCDAHLAGAANYQPPVESLARSIIETPPL